MLRPRRLTLSCTPALAGLMLVTFTAACASSGGSPRSTATATTQQPAAPIGTVWPVKTREHIDLWLHAFALLKPDSSKVPYFRRDYFDELTVYKNSRNIRTRLDGNRAKLIERFEISRTLINSQFLAIYFGSWDDMRRYFNLFFAAEGDPRRASNPSTQDAIAIIGGYYRTAADREWARLFMSSLEDEYNKFYRDYWVAQQQRRAASLAGIDSLWQQTYYPKFRRFLEGSEQRRGDFILSLPLNGEGRLLPSSANEPGGKYNYLVVNFPAERADALHAIYTLAHELSGRVVEIAVGDNTTPAEGRNGVRAAYEGDGLVVGGYYLLKKIAPDIAEGYARYYLQGSRVTIVSGTPEAALLAAFPLPQIIRESLIRQIDAVLAGI
jgi:hypothetical protein